MLIGGGQSNVLAVTDGLYEGCTEKSDITHLRKQKILYRYDPRELCNNRVVCVRPPRVRVTYGYGMLD